MFNTSANTVYNLQLIIIILTVLQCQTACELFFFLQLIYKCYLKSCIQCIQENIVNTKICVCRVSSCFLLDLPASLRIWDMADPFNAGVAPENH